MSGSIRAIGVIRVPPREAVACLGDSVVGGYRIGVMDRTDRISGICIPKRSGMSITYPHRCGEDAMVRDVIGKKICVLRREWMIGLDLYAAEILADADAVLAKGVAV